jgi:signal transduction histidine kinase
MLKRLKRRIIVITVALLAIVLAAVLGITVFVNYRSEYNEIQTALDNSLLNASINVVVKPSVGGDDNIPVFVERFDSYSGYYVALTKQNVEMKDPQTMYSATAEVLLSNQASGELKDLNLFYRKSSLDVLTGSEYIAFADSSQLYRQLFSRIIICLIIFLSSLVILVLIGVLLAHIALKPAEESWERQRKFIADASHELKTPLTVIMANNAVIESSPDSLVKDQRNWLEASDAEAQKMDHLVRDLLTLAQADEEDELSASERRRLRKHRNKTVSTDFSATVERELLQFEAVFFERGAEVNAKVQGKLKVAVPDHELARLITILLDNASKYTPIGGKVQVDLRNESIKSQPYALLSVQNSGDPIPPDKLEHLFDRFYRVDDAHSEETEGFGLGLALAKHICESAGGSIIVQSDQANGTIFWVRLPLV